MSFEIYEESETRIQVYLDSCMLVLLLSFDVFVPGAHPLLFMDNWFVQIYLNINNIGAYYGSRPC